MDSKATENDPRKSDSILSYIPIDPSLRDSPALVHLQQCILQVAAQAIGSGNSMSLVQSRLSQHQLQFDAFLGTLDGLFRPRPPTNHFQRRRLFAPPQYNRSPEVPALLLDPTVPQKTASVTAVWNDHDTDTSLRSGDNFPDTPQFMPDNPRYLENRRRHLEAVAIQQALIDEDRRAANSNMVGDWLENVSERPVNTAQYLSQSDNPNKRRRTSVSQAEDNAADLPGVGDYTADLVPTSAEYEPDVPPPG